MNGGTTLWMVRVASKKISGGVGGAWLSFEVLGTHHKVTLCHILEDMNPGYSMRHLQLGTGHLYVIIT